MEKHNILASQQRIKNNIKGGKIFADRIMDSAQIMALLTDYHIKYGEDRFTQLIISSYAEIRGGISFDNSRGQLANLIKKLVLK